MSLLAQSIQDPLSVGVLGAVIAALFGLLLKAQSETKKAIEEANRREAAVLEKVLPLATEMTAALNRMLAYLESRDDSAKEAMGKLDRVLEKLGEA